MLLGLDPGQDVDLLVGGGVLLSWRSGRVAALEPRFDPVARLVGSDVSWVAPDAVTDALGERPGGLDGLALLASLADERLLLATATELAIEAAAELLTLEPEHLEVRQAPEGRAPVADLAIAPSELLDLATATGRTRFEVATTLSALWDAGLVRLTPGAATWPVPWMAPAIPEAGSDPGAEAGVDLGADLGAAWLELREVAAGARARPDPAPEMVPAVQGDVDSSSLLRELASINLGDEPDEPGIADGSGDVRPQRAAAPATGDAAAQDDRAKGGRFGFRRSARR